MYGFHYNLPVVVYAVILMFRMCLFKNWSSTTLQCEGGCSATMIKEWEFRRIKWSLSLVSFRLWSSWDLMVVRDIKWKNFTRPVVRLVLVCLPSFSTHHCLALVQHVCPSCLTASPFLSLPCCRLGPYHIFFSTLLCSPCTTLNPYPVLWCKQC